MILLLVFPLFWIIPCSFKGSLSTKMLAMPLLTLINVKHSFLIFLLLIPPLALLLIAPFYSPIWASPFILRACLFPKLTLILFLIAFRELLPVGNPESFLSWGKCLSLTFAFFLSSGILHTLCHFPL